MSNVIDFLERMGQDATLRYGDKHELAAAMTQMDVQLAHQATVLQGDQAPLESLLGAQANVCCTIEPFHEPDADGRDARHAIHGSDRAAASN
jgi:hypothetical protein